MFKFKLKAFCIMKWKIYRSIFSTIFHNFPFSFSFFNVEYKKSFSFVFPTWMHNNHSFKYVSFLWKTTWNTAELDSLKTIGISMENSPFWTPIYFTKFSKTFFFLVFLLLNTKKSRKSLGKTWKNQKSLGN